MDITLREYEENKNDILGKLDEYTREIVPKLDHYESDKISLVMEDEGVIVGQIVGEIRWNYLRIELFFVNQEIRGKGIGSRLLKTIERIAVQKKCNLILLETMSFNAPNFYLNHGYEAVGRIDNHPLPNESHYFMVKYLKESA